MRSFNYIPKRNPLEESDEFKALSKAEDEVLKCMKYKESIDCLIAKFKNHVSVDALNKLKIEIYSEYDNAVKIQKKCLEAYNKLEDKFVLS